MIPGDSNDEQHVFDDIRKRQQFSPEPKRLANVISSLMARRGYAQLRTNEVREAAWREAAGTRLAKNTRTGNKRGGVLEVHCRNSAVLQELTFQKKRILGKFNKLAPDEVISDLRFRVGEID